MKQKKYLGYIGIRILERKVWVIIPPGWQLNKAITYVMPIDLISIVCAISSQK
jgi:hypothetical protein